ncbi:MAG: hypothetical protein M1833_001969 [Piccolia ochrophora]|nr:MAG: hypothetical protein M1833_001969 [Piccolia ochrophora]
MTSVKRGPFPPASSKNSPRLRPTDYGSPSSAPPPTTSSGSTTAVAFVPSTDNGAPVLVAVFESFLNTSGASLALSRLRRDISPGALHPTINLVVSKDDGATWGNRQRVPTSTDGTASHIVAVGGTLVVSFMGSQGEGFAARLVASQRISAAGEVLFGEETELVGAPGAWPALVGFNERMALYLVDHDGMSRVQKIVVGG